MLPFVSSLLLVALAEMGDKTQLVALAFAGKYRARTVLAGVFLATLVVHLFSVGIGAALAVLVPLSVLHLVAGLSFIAFGLWTIRGDSLDDKPAAGETFGPLLTVAISFFFAELGDKTQLATISLTSEYNAPLGVWLGSTIGMVLADGLAIGIALVLGKSLPERWLKWGAAAVFIVSGLVTMGEALSVHL